MESKKKAIRYELFVPIGLFMIFSLFGCEGGTSFSQKNRCKTDMPQLLVNLIPEIMDKTENAGINLKYQPSNCKYSKEDDTLTIDVSLEWNGPLTGDYYQLKGVLQDTPYLWEWTTKGGNQNLQAWYMLKGKKFSDVPVTVKKYNTIYLENQCTNAISVAFAYVPVIGDLKTKGWISIKSGEIVDTGITTKQNVAYFYGTDGNKNTWQGKKEDGGIERQIVNESFSYEQGEAPKGNKPFSVVFRKTHLISKAENKYLTQFTCPQ